MCRGYSHVGLLSTRQHLSVHGCAVLIHGEVGHSIHPFSARPIVHDLELICTGVIRRVANNLKRKNTTYSIFLVTIEN